MNEVDVLFESFFYDFCSLAKWIFAIKMVSDVLKKATCSDTEGVIRSLLNGVVGYSSLYFIVKILDRVELAFLK